MVLSWKPRTPIWSGEILRPFRQRDPLIGLDIGSQLIKLVQLTLKRGEWHLQFCGLKSLPWPREGEEEVISEMAIEDALRELVREGHLRQAQVACSIKGPSVMVKSIQVPIMTAQELKDHLGLEMDHYIPSDGGDIRWDYHIANRRNQEAAEGLMSVLLVAAKKEAVHKRVKVIQRAGLKPIVVDVDTMALSNMYGFNYDEGDPKRILLIHVSPSGVNMNVINEGIPIFSREMEVGGDEYRRLMEHAVRNSLEKQPSGDLVYRSEFSEIDLEKVLREISKEVKKTIEYCSDLTPPIKIQKLFLDGGYASVTSLVRTIEAEINLPLEFLDPFRKLTVPSSLKRRASIKNLQHLAGVATGLALRGIEHS